MWKIIKRTLLVVVVLIVLGIGSLIAHANSEKFATTIVSLECTLTKASSEDFHQRLIKNGRETGYSRLKNDWIKGDVLLTWLESTAGESETGLEPLVRMNKDIKSYNSVTHYHSDNYIHRSFDRNSLIYKKEVTTSREVYSGTSKNWLERQCKIIPNQKFDKLRDESAAATKAMQKI